VRTGTRGPSPFPKRRDFDFSFFSRRAVKSSFTRRAYPVRRSRASFSHASARPPRPPRKRDASLLPLRRRSDRPARRGGPRARRESAGRVSLLHLLVVAPDPVEREAGHGDERGLGGASRAGSRGRAAETGRQPKVGPPRARRDPAQPVAAAHDVPARRAVDVRARPLRGVPETRFSTKNPPDLHVSPLFTNTACATPRWTTPRPAFCRAS